MDRPSCLKVMLLWSQFSIQNMYRVEISHFWCPFAVLEYSLYLIDVKAYMKGSWISINVCKYLPIPYSIPVGFDASSAACRAFSSSSSSSLSFSFLGSKICWPVAEELPKQVDDQLAVSSHLEKYDRQIGSSPQASGQKLTNLWNRWHDLPGSKVNFFPADWQHPDTRRSREASPLGPPCHFCKARA